MRQAAHKQEFSAPLPGALPTTPSPTGTPWTDFRTPKEEPSSTSSEAEALAAPAASPQSSSSESSKTSGSSLSEADITPAHQNNPAIKSLGAYRLLRTTANQRHHNMSLTLPFHVDTDEQ
ncbi:hypothetical protein C0993_001087 [Termitomyces sp. T159_Od127]|nr:hypothetical protein C0993_001087 [Termitomyces sp. T159_Od127]